MTQTDNREGDALSKDGLKLVQILRHGMGRKMRGLGMVIGIAVMTASQPVVAQHDGIAGQSEAAFEDALAHWLQDDESTALTQLAALAGQGNSAARLLLGQIDKTPALQGPWLTRLTRADRIALLRAEGGLSGQNWIALDADQSPQARLWHDLWQGREGLNIARAFDALGDRRAVAQAVLAVASRQQTPFDAQTLAQDWFPTGLAHLGDGWGPDAAVLVQLHAGDPQRDMLGEPPDSDDRADWLATQVEALALRALCDTRCPETSAACAAVLLTAFSAYQALLTHGSPASTLVDDDTFAHSAKGQASLARRIMLGRAARLRQPHLAQIATQDACAADWLRGEFARYDPVVPPAPKAPE